MRNFILALSVFLLLVSGRVTAAAFGAAGFSKAPWNASTIAEFLSNCPPDSQLCKFEIRSVLLDKLLTRSSAQDATKVCITSGHFQQAILDWLQAHPETHKMKTEDGIYAAYVYLYPCQQKPAIKVTMGAQ